MRYLLLVTSLFFVFNIWGQKTLVLFESDSYEITQKEQGKLTYLTDLILKKYSDQVIVIYGFTDSDGAKLYNDKLSYNRAHAVKDFLELNGVKNQIHLVGKGEDEVLRAENSEYEKARNRKVVIDLDYVEKNIVHKVFKVPDQKFKIYNNVDQYIVCENGTEIFFPKFCFKTMVDSPIEISVKECLKMSDFIGEQLFTQTLNNEVIESKGMVKIEAVQDGRPVNIKDDEEIQILFKDRTEGDNTQTFFGVEQEDGVRWEPRKLNYEYGKVTYWEKYRGHQVVEKGSYHFARIDGKTLKIETITNARGETHRTKCEVSTVKKVNDLAITSNRLGWINCDRFLRSNLTLDNLTVQIDADQDPFVYLVLEDFNSIMKFSSRTDNRYTFKNLPKGVHYKIVAMYRDDTMRNPLLTVKEGKLNASQTISLNLKESSMDEILAFVRQL